MFGLSGQSGNIDFNLIHSKDSTNLSSLLSQALTRGNIPSSSSSSSSSSSLSTSIQSINPNFQQLSNTNSELGIINSLNENNNYNNINSNNNNNNNDSISNFSQKNTILPPTINTSINYNPILNYPSSSNNTLLPPSNNIFQSTGIIDTTTNISFNQNLDTLFDQANQLTFPTNKKNCLTKRIA